MTTGVVIPVRGFAAGKARLQPLLDVTDRAALLETMATTVVRAAGERPVLVVSSADEVRAWAGRLGIDVVDDPGTLDAAAGAGRAWWAEKGAARVVIVHADLPLAETLDQVDSPEAAADCVLAVACRSGDGTPTLSLPATPAGLQFRFAYGPGSFARHRQEAHRVGLRFVPVDDPTLAFDVDTPADIDDLARSVPTTPLPA